MVEISANLIKEIREKTGAGVLDCKKALLESGGNLEAAIEVLRKTGAAKAEKKTGRITAEGRVEVLVKGNEAVLVEVNCETDFVAKNEDFQKIVAGVAEQILSNKPANVEALLETSLNGQKLSEVVRNFVAKSGENTTVRRFALVQAQTGEKLGSYVHMGNKIGVVVRMKGPADQLSAEVMRDVAMHVAAASPQYLNREAIPAEILEREKGIYKEQMKEVNKPPQVLEKILEGKLAKFADEVCLINQVYVKDPTGKLSVSQHLKQIHPEISVVEFVRYQVGEGLAKKNEDFAAEVAKAAHS